MATKKQTLQTKRRALSSAGLRMTRQRALILDIISQGRGHLDADEVYRLIDVSYSRKLYGDAA